MFAKKSDLFHLGGTEKLKTTDNDILNVAFEALNITGFFFSWSVLKMGKCNKKYL